MKKTIDVSNKTGELEIVLDKEGTDLEIVGRLWDRLGFKKRSAFFHRRMLPDNAAAGLGKKTHRLDGSL